MIKNIIKPTQIFKLVVGFLLILTIYSTANAFTDTVIITGQEAYLGKYVQNEIVIQFKESEINVHSKGGENEVVNFLKRKSDELTPLILEKLDNENKIDKSQILAGDISKLKESLVKLDHNFSSANGALLKISIDDAVTEIIEEMIKDPAVEMISPNYIIEFDTTPTETYYSNGQLWGLNNTEATISPEDYETNNPGTSGVDIQAAEAWSKTTGDSSVVVAILDTGMDYDHTDLENNMWDGSSCVDVKRPQFF